LPAARKLRTPAELGDRNGLVAIVDHNSKPAQQIGRTSAGRIAIRIGDRKRLACDQPGHIGERRVGSRRRGPDRADERQAVT
jgi:hypothetical protein